MGEALNFESVNGKWYTNQPFEWRNYNNDQISGNDFKDEFDLIKPCGEPSTLMYKYIFHFLSRIFSGSIWGSRVPLQVEHCSAR